jgi:hypothetical protein
MQAAWWSWTAVGRMLLPSLRVDPDVYVDTSSYGRQGIDHLTRALGIDAVVRGSDHV